MMGKHIDWIHMKTTDRIQSGKDLFFVFMHESSFVHEEVTSSLDSIREGY